MELGSIFLILALLVLVIAFISQPFYSKKGHPENRLDHQLNHEWSNLLAEKERILAAIAELDFDFSLGKLEGEAYTSQRSWLVSSGVEVLRKLDSMVSTPGGINQSIHSKVVDINMPDLSSSMRDEGEELPRRNNGVPGEEVESEKDNLVSFPEDDLEILLARRGQDRREKSCGFCPSCGEPVRKSDRYCPKCGAKKG